MIQKTCKEIQRGLGWTQVDKTKLPKDVRDFFVKQGSLGGKIGGKRRMGELSPEQRTELARKAVAARIKKRADGRMSD
jgi:hypothetical protein